MLSLFLILILIIILDRWKPRRLKEVHKQLGNDTWYLPLLGHSYHFIGSNEHRMQKLQEAARMAFNRKNGAISAWFAHVLIIEVVEAESAMAVLKTSHDKEFVHDIAKHLIGNGTVFAPPKVWHRRRKILAPTFATKYLSTFVQIFEAHSKIIAEQFEHKVGQGNFSCWNYFNPYALDAICETAFGIDIGIQNQPDNLFLKAFNSYFNDAALRLCQPWMQIEELYKLLPIAKRQNEMKKIIFYFIDKLIQKKKSWKKGNLESSQIFDIENLNHAKSSRVDIKSFLELMIESSEEIDKGYTHEELREELIVLAMAGTDTSATGISFTAVMLSQNSEVQEKLYKEIQEVFGDSDRPITMEDLYKLKYLEAVIKETLRMYPPVPVIIRNCKEDIKLPSGIIVPAGSCVVINIWGIHRNPQYWSNADVFDPDRFLTEAQPPPGSFMPFSYGPRNCVANRYTMLSMKTTLVTIVRQYRLLPATSFTYGEHNPLRVSFEMMMKHVDNFEIQIEKRNKIGTSKIIFGQEPSITENIYRAEMSGDLKTILNL